MQEAGKREQDVKDQKSEIAELIRQIQRLKAELEILSKQVSIASQLRHWVRSSNKSILSVACTGSLGGSCSRGWGTNGWLP